MVGQPTSLSDKIKRIKQGLSPIPGNGIWPDSPGAPSDRGPSLPGAPPRPIIKRIGMAARGKRKSA